MGIFPTPSYSSCRLTVGYNFNPMMGQPLRPSVSSPYSFLSQSPEMLLSTSFGLSLVDLPGLLDIDDEGPPPLVVEPPACSSHIVMGGTVPTITISSSVVETTLSASLRLSPRVSTSSASTVGRDVWRVIQQHSPTSAKKALVQAGAGQGSIIDKNLAKICPPSNIAKALPVVMKLNPQGPPVSYADAASKQPQKKGVTEDTVHMCDVCMRDVL